MPGFQGEELKFLIETARYLRMHGYDLVDLVGTLMLLRYGKHIDERENRELKFYLERVPHPKIIKMKSQALHSIYDALKGWKKLYIAPHPDGKLSITLTEALFLKTQPKYHAIRSELIASLDFECITLDSQYGDPFTVFSRLLRHLGLEPMAISILDEETLDIILDELRKYRIPWSFDTAIFAIEQGIRCGEIPRDEVVAQQKDE